jgi:hypothetical protein
MTPANYVDQIKKCLEPCCTIIEEVNDFRNGNWTETIKKLLGNLGERLGCKVCASTWDKKYNAEWLYDLVWYRENNDGNLVEVPLVVECEWGTDTKKDIKFDFEKLLLAKADIKLMICSNNDIKSKEYLAYFREALDVCPLINNNELFLIAILKLNGIDAEGFEFYELYKNSLCLGS